MRPGDAVLLRSIYRGTVRWTFPHHFVGTWDGRLGLYCQPGNRGKLTKQVMGEGYLQRWASGAPPFDYVWDRSHVLRFMRAGDVHTVELFWDLDWRFTGWYVNLQAPLVVSWPFLDTTDLALDIVVAPDGSWRWKDEDDFAEAIALGILDERAAEEIRAEGERVAAARPWPTGWEDWRPPPDWEPLPLPAGWEEVERETAHRSTPPAAAAPGAEATLDSP